MDVAQEVASEGTHSGGIQLEVGSVGDKRRLNMPSIKCGRL